MYTTGTHRRRGHLWQRGLALAVMSIAFVGCTTSARVNQFREFADTAVVYSDAMTALLDTAGELSIDADSATLTSARELTDFPAPGALGRSDAEQLAYLQVLADSRKHVRTLKDYFVALSKLAESDAPSEISEELGKSIEGLSATSSTIANATIGNATVESVAVPLTKLAVATFRSGELVSELNARKDVLQEELALLEKLLTRVAVDVQADAEGLLAYRRRVEVVRPYETGRALAKTWRKSRRELLTAKATVEGIGGAQTAAKKFREAFEALVADKLTLEQLTEILTELGALQDICNAIRGGNDE